MVQATISNGTVNLESILTITEGQRNVIKKESKAVKSLLKDIHLNHTITVNEDGTPVSKLSGSVSGNFDPIKEIDELQKTHTKFLEAVNGMIKTTLAENSGKPTANHEESKEEFLERIHSKLHKRFLKAVIITIDDEWNVKVICQIKHSHII